MITCRDIAFWLLTFWLGYVAGRLCYQIALWMRDTFDGRK